MLNPAQIKERYPLVRTEDLVGAIYHPTDGYINPADVTMAMAKGARQRGVTVERKWQADAYEWTGSDWKVTLSKMVEQGGNLLASEEQIVVHAEHVVTATGNHAQRTAKLLGIKTPAIPVEHQFIVTEPDPALVDWRKTNGEHPVLRDADAKWYVRERGGWILAPTSATLRAVRTACPVLPISFRSIWNGSKKNMSMIHRSLRKPWG